MRISVIIPNYNHSKYLKERIDSVLNQTYQDFEVIILDDYSTDDSKDVIEEYRENIKISHIIYNTENSGSTFKQWEKGISLAKGEWIWIAESDDMADTRFLEELLVGCISDENVVLGYCSSMNISATGERLGRNKWGDDLLAGKWNSDYYDEGQFAIENYLFYKNIIVNASAVIFKKSAADTTVFDTISKMRYAGDWLFWIKILEQGKLYYKANCLNYFRHHESTTRSLRSNEIEIKRFQEIISIITEIKLRYKLQWNIRKHNWLLNEWYRKSKDLALGYFPAGLPIVYRIGIFIKHLKSPLYKNK